MRERHHDLRSHFHYYSFGIVIGDKDRNSKTIIVFPTESQMEYGGDVTSVREIEDVEIYNELEDLKKVSVAIDQKLEATWIPLGQDNRISPPDVCNGEVVMLYKVGESDTIFWDSCFTENKLRRKEHRIIALSNTDDNTELLHEGNMYWQGMDTRDKKVQMIYTGDNDDEETTYDFHFKTDDGYMVIIDGKGNKIHMDSAAGKLTFEAKDEITIDAPNVNIKCREFKLEATTGKMEVQKLSVEGMSYTNSYQSASFESTMFELQGSTIMVNGLMSITPPLLTTSTLAQT